MVTKNAHSTVILHDNNFPHLHTVHAVKTKVISVVISSFMSMARLTAENRYL